MAQSGEREEGCRKRGGRTPSLALGAVIKSSVSGTLSFETSGCDHWSPPPTHTQEPLHPGHRHGGRPDSSAPAKSCSRGVVYCAQVGGAAMPDALLLTASLSLAVTATPALGVCHCCLTFLPCSSNKSLIQKRLFINSGVLVQLARGAVSDSISRSAFGG